MHRRTFLCGLALGTLAIPLAAEAQKATKIWRIGVLAAPTMPKEFIEAFQSGLREHGYVEGRDVRIDWRFAHGKAEPLPELAAELVASNVDVIVAVGGPAALVAKRATASIPIVFTIVPDPVASGLVRSLARPGGNATGVAFTR